LFEDIFYLFKKIIYKQSGGVSKMKHIFVGLFVASMYTTAVVLTSQYVLAGWFGDFTVRLACATFLWYFCRGFFNSLAISKGKKNVNQPD
jgi:hypothetical protein